ncbi:sialidase family protein, partial [Myxococcota bacterium]
MIARFGTDTLYVVWTDYRGGVTDPGIYCARSVDAGETWSASSRVDDDATASAQVAPHIAVDTLGTVYVVWQDHRNGDPDILFSRSLDGCQTFSASVLVEDTTHASYGPVIAAGVSGQLFVGAHSVIKQNNSDLLFTRSYDGGVMWTGNVLATEAATEKITEENLAAGIVGDLTVATVFEENSNGHRDVFYGYTSDGGDTWGYRIRINNDAEDNRVEQIEPSMAMDATGTMYFVWTDYRNGTADIYFAKDDRATARGTFRWLDVRGNPLADEALGLTDVAPRTPLHLRLNVEAIGEWGLVARDFVPIGEVPGDRATVVGSYTDLAADDGVAEEVLEEPVISYLLFHATTGAAASAGEQYSGTIVSTETDNDAYHTLRETDRQGNPSDGPGDLDYVYTFSGLANGDRVFSLRA